MGRGGNPHVVMLFEEKRLIMIAVSLTECLMWHARRGKKRREEERRREVGRRDEERRRLKAETGADFQGIPPPPLLPRSLASPPFASPPQEL